MIIIDDFFSFECTIKFWYFKHMKYLILSFEIGVTSWLRLYRPIWLIKTRQKNNERMIRSDVALSTPVRYGMSKKNYFFELFVFTVFVKKKKCNMQSFWCQNQNSLIQNSFFFLCFRPRMATCHHFQSLQTNYSRSYWHG